MSDESKELDFELHQFSSNLIGVAPKSTSRNSRFNRTQVRKFLKDPFKNSDKLQEVSSYLKSTSGNYNRILKYLSGILTFDYFIYPDIKPKFMDKKEKILDDFEKVAKELDKLNIKYNFRWILEKLVENGEIYLYKLSDSKSVVYREMPSNCCRISEIDDGVYRYEFDLKEIRAKTVDEYPNEIQLAYEKYKKDRKVFLDGWYPVSDKGFAFNAIGNYPKGFPMLSFMFDDIMGLDDKKDLMEQKDKLDSIKLIHQKIPLDKEGKKPIFDGKQTKTFHEATKKNIPSTVAVTTNPFDVTVIPFEKVAKTGLDNIERAENNIWNSSGISSLIFGNNNASGEALKKSLIADETYMYPFLYMFSNYMNKEIYKTKWKFKFLEVSYFNRDDKMKLAKDNLAFGGSRFYFLALNGMTPLESLNLLRFEQEFIDIDKYLVSKDTSYTQSGDHEGRPQEDDIGEAGEKTREQQ